MPVARAPSPHAFVCILPCISDGSQVAPFSARPAHPWVVHHVAVPLELAWKSDLGLVEPVLDVLIPDLLRPSLTSPSRPCQHSLVRGLVVHIINMGFGHVSSMCIPPQASGGCVSKTVTELISLLWLSQCVDVSFLPLCCCHRPEAGTSCTKLRV